MKFTKQHLLKSDYSWETVSSTELIFPSRKVFNRYNGWHMIMLINYTNRSLSNREDIIKRGQTIEDLISSRLPMQNLSEVAVCNWLLKQKLS